MREALRRRHPDLWASGQWTPLQDNARPHTALSVSRFLTKHNVTVLTHPPYSPDLSPCDFFLFPQLKKRLKGRRHENIEATQAAATMELTGIQQLLSRLAETLATVYGLRRELLRRGQEALVVRLNFVFFYRLSLRPLRTKDVDVTKATVFVKKQRSPYFVH
jgi:transposase